MRSFYEPFVQQKTTFNKSIKAFQSSVYSDTDSVMPIGISWNDVCLWGIFGVCGVCYN